MLMLASCTPEPAAVAGDESAPLAQWRLPERLREISGLALSDDERLYAVTDEQAVVYEIDYESGRLVRAFAAGDPVLRGDFEGIASIGERIWLMDSGGTLISMPLGDDGAQVDFLRFDTDLDDECEFEGLAANAAENELLLLCKASKKKRKKGLRIFVFEASEDSIHFVSEIALDEDGLKDAVDEKEPRFSGLEFDRQSGELIAIAARERIVVRLARDGRLNVVIMRLDKNKHRQAEGVALTSDRRLLIADEGGNGRARLTVYQLR